MGGPKDCHSEQSRLERERQISIILLICGMQKNDIDEFTCKAEISHRCRKQTNDYQGGKWGQAEMELRLTQTQYYI